VGHDAAGELSVPRPHLRIARARDGSVRLRIPHEERELLRALPDQLREMLVTDDAATRRLFPPAHPDDPEREAEYRELTRGALLEDRLAGLDVVEATLDADRLDPEQASAWLTTLNAARLVLGTQLGVTGETAEERIPPDHPDVMRHTVYDYLGWLVAQLVEALAPE
jgi:hypothetical protein